MMRPMTQTSNIPTPRKRHIFYAAKRFFRRQCSFIYRDQSWISPNTIRISLSIIKIFTTIKYYLSERRFLMGAACLQTYSGPHNAMGLARRHLQCVNLATDRLYETNRTNRRVASTTRFAGAAILPYPLMFSQWLEIAFFRNC